MGKISEEKLERRESGRHSHKQGVCLPRSEPMTWLGNLGLLVSGLKVSGGWILQILELLACGGALLSGDNWKPRKVTSIQTSFGLSD